MINQYSVVDGLRVILGNQVIHVAALITLIAMARPPDYDSEEERDIAVSLFWELVASHILFAICNFLYAFIYNASVLLNVVCTFWQVIIAV